MTYTLDDIRCLLEVVRAGSMTKASPALGVSTAAVSRRIERLERDLGVHLLNRGPHGVGPTPDAEALLLEAEPLIRGLEEAVATALRGEEELTGALRLTAPRAIAENFLSDWLVEFALERPGLAIELIATDSWVALVEEAIDVAIRVGPLPDSDDTAIRLGTVRYVLAHGPDYDADELLARLADEGWSALASHPCVVASPVRTWRVESDDGAVVVAPSAAFEVNSLALVARAVARGVGVGYLPVDVAERASLTVVPLEDFGLSGMQRPVFAVTPRGQFRRRKVTAVLEMLREKLETHEGSTGLQR